jgi:hypothetical protein
VKTPLVGPAQLPPLPGAPIAPPSSASTLPLHQQHTQHQQQLLASCVVAAAAATVKEVAVDASLPIWPRASHASSSVVSSLSLSSTAVQVPPNSHISNPSHPNAHLLLISPLSSKANVTSSSSSSSSNDATVTVTSTIRDVHGSFPMSPSHSPHILPIDVNAAVSQSSSTVSTPSTHTNSADDIVSSLSSYKNNNNNLNSISTSTTPSPSSIMRRMNDSSSIRPARPTGSPRKRVQLPAEPNFLPSEPLISSQTPLLATVTAPSTPAPVVPIGISASTPSSKRPSIVLRGNHVNVTPSPMQLLSPYPATATSSRVNVRFNQNAIAVANGILASSSSSLQTTASQGGQSPIASSIMLDSVLGMPSPSSNSNNNGHFSRRHVIMSTTSTSTSTISPRAMPIATKGPHEPEFI